jgi:hypothetical protein
MDPQVQGSFIPKEALAASARRGSGMGLLLMLAILIFVASLGAAGAVVGWEYLLNKQITKNETDLTAREKAFEVTSIQDLIRLDKRLSEAKGLLQKHVSPSVLFSFLADITLQKVQFTAFDYSLKPDGTAGITLEGNADSFQSVALQSDKFGGTQVLKDVVFSNITVGTTGRVNFSIAATVDSKYLLYSRNLQSQTTP